MQKRNQTMWTKIATAVVPKIVEDIYEYVKFNYFEEKEGDAGNEGKPTSPKKYDTYKFTEPEIRYIVKAHTKLKLTGNYNGYVTLNELYDHFNNKFGINKHHRTYYELIRKHKRK